MAHEHPWFIITRNEIQKIQDRLHRIDARVFENRTGQPQCDHKALYSYTPTSWVS